MFDDTDDVFIGAAAIVIALIAFLTILCLIAGEVRFLMWIFGM